MPLSTTTVGARSCQNIANLFNLAGMTDATPEEAELWSTWIVGAPNVVPDANHDGQCDAKDLRALGVASKIEQVRFFINPWLPRDKQVNARAP